MTHAIAIIISKMGSNQARKDVNFAATPDDCAETTEICSKAPTNINVDVTLMFA